MGRVYNCFTVVFMLLTAAVIVVTVGIAGEAFDSPVFAPEEEELIIPTQFALPEVGGLPSFTPSNTPDAPTVTLTPTLTPSSSATAVVATYTPESTATLALSPTAILAGPTSTATATLTFTPSPTLTFTPSPTGPSPSPTATLSPYAFMVQAGTPLPRSNFANTSGCNWQGVAGQVITDRGDAVTGIQVRVSGEGIEEEITLTGSNTAYGPSGWEVVLAETPVTAAYRVELMVEGQAVSLPVDIVFPGACEQNLILINFVQTRPF